jgi:hypothetical protein
MSWKFVLNSSLHSAGTTFDKILEVCAISGYKFFTFNRAVFFIADGKAVLTGITVEDLY